MSVLLAEEQLIDSLGSFWNLFNNIKMGRAEGILGLSCSETGFGLDRYLGSSKPIGVIQNPGGCCGHKWRPTVQQVLSLVSHPNQIKDIVFFTHSGCRFLEADTHFLHVMRQFRHLATFELLGNLLVKKKIRLHAWMEGDRGQFLVLHPEKLQFVSPLALR